AFPLPNLCSRASDRSVPAGLLDQPREPIAARSRRLRICAAETKCAPNHSAQRGPVDTAPRLYVDDRRLHRNGHRSAELWHKRNSLAPDLDSTTAPSSARCVLGPCHLLALQRAQCSPNRQDSSDQSLLPSRRLPARLSDRPATASRCRNRSSVANRLPAM